MRRVRVLLVDDNDDFLDGVSAWLKHDPQLEILGRAHSGPQALERVGELHPDLVVMDITVPDMNGFEATRRIKSEPGSPQVVLLTFHESNAARLEAWAAGADGFVSKSEIAEKLMPVVRDLIRQRREAIAAQPSRRDEELEQRCHGKPGPARDL